MNYIEAIELIQCQDCPPFSIYGEEVRLLPRRPFRVAFEAPPSFQGNFQAEIHRVGPGGESLEFLYESESLSVIPGANFILVHTGVSESEGFLFLQLAPQEGGEDLRYFARLSLNSTNIGNGIGDGAGDQAQPGFTRRLENSLQQRVGGCGLDVEAQRPWRWSWVFLVVVLMGLGLLRRQRN